MKKTKKFNSILIHSFSPGQNKEVNDKDGLKYHYTSPSGLLSIINNGNLYFTDIRYLNDKSENVYLIKAMLEFLEKNKSSYHITREVFYDLFKEHSFDDLRNLRVQNIVYNLPNKYIPLRKFVFCTTTDADSLNMWNYYIHDGHYQGYNIGFNIERLLKTFDTKEPHTADPFEVLYGKVIYEPKKQTEEIQSYFDLIETLSEEVKVDKETLILNLYHYIDRYGVFYKSSSFSSEKEYRICVEINEEQLKKDKKNYFGPNNKKINYSFRTSNGLIIPYIEVKLKEDSISRIYISPMMEFEIAKESIRELITQNGFKGVSIHRSKIPVRF